MRTSLAIMAGLFATLSVAAGELEQQAAESLRRAGLPPVSAEEIARYEKQRGVEATIGRIMIAVKDCPGYVVDDRRVMQALMQAGSNALPARLRHIHERSSSRAATADEPERTDCSNLFARFGHPGVEFAGAVIPVPSLLAVAPSPLPEPQAPQPIGSAVARKR